LAGLPPARRVIAPWVTVRRAVTDFYRDSGRT
jgi:hypothetical protein